MLLSKNLECITLRAFLIITATCGSLFLKSQNADAYQKIYTKTYLDISQKDFPRAMKLADSLYSISETPRFKAKSLMLSATLLQQSGEIKQAIDYAMKSEEILAETDDHVWKAKIAGFLSTQYRHLGLFDQSKKYTDETLSYIKKIDDPRPVNQMMGFVMQEKAYYDIEMEKYSQSVSHVKEAQRYFELSGQTDPFLMANNEQLLGLGYYHLKAYEKALELYGRALEKLDKIPDNFLKALVLSGIAQVYIGKNNMPEAKKHLDRAQKLATESPFLSLKNAIYETSQQYYAATKDLDKLQDATSKKDSISKKLLANSSRFIDESYSNLEKKTTESEKKTLQKNYWLLLLITLLTAGLLYFYIYRKKQKTNYDRINKILTDLELAKKKPEANHLSDSVIVEVGEKDSGIDPVQADNNQMMTPATEKKILAKLEKFEHSKLFTKSMVSLPYLASYCSTNTKYLSYVVNHYKKKDFKNYINELRVNYIIDKLTTDTMYKKYKMSTLAEETGFSSQSKFAAAFKKVTSVSPSEFLAHLKTQGEKNQTP